MMASAWAIGAGPGSCEDPGQPAHHLSPRHVKPSLSSSSPSPRTLLVVPTTTTTFGCARPAAGHGSPPSHRVAVPKRSVARAHRRDVPRSHHRAHTDGSGSFSIEGHPREVGRDGARQIGAAGDHEQLVSGPVEGEKCHSVTTTTDLIRITSRLLFVFSAGLMSLGLWENGAQTVRKRGRGKRELSAFLWC